MVLPAARRVGDKDTKNYCFGIISDVLAGVPFFTNTFKKGVGIFFAPRPRGRVFAPSLYSPLMSRLSPYDLFAFGKPKRIRLLLQDS